MIKKIFESIIKAEIKYSEEWDNLAGGSIGFFDTLDVEETLNWIKKNKPNTYVRMDELFDIEASDIADLDLSDLILGLEVEDTDTDILAEYPVLDGHDEISKEYYVWKALEAELASIFPNTKAFLDEVFNEYGL